jgi:CelD/BcsL family acetyltransferase involved in cellulose biosynthesis
MTGEILEENVSNKLKPGLVAHFLAIEYYKKLGFEVYDFMGGDARYKASFSNKISGLIIAKFQRKTVLLGIENLLKMVKFKIVQLARNGQFDGKSL